MRQVSIERGVVFRTKTTVAVRSLHPAGLISKMVAENLYFIEEVFFYAKF